MTVELCTDFLLSGSARRQSFVGGGGQKSAGTEFPALPPNFKVIKLMVYVTSVRKRYWNFCL